MSPTYPYSQHSPALEVPELLEKIGKCLPHQDLIRCLRVCKFFNTNLAPLLYYSLDLNIATAMVESNKGHNSDSHEEGGFVCDCQKIYCDGGRGYGPTAGILTKYAPMVRRVKIDACVSDEYLSVGFTNLTEITLNCNIRRPNRALKDTEMREIQVEALVNLIHTNKNLVSWTIGPFCIHPLPAQIWKAIVESAQERLQKSTMLGEARGVSTTELRGLELLEVNVARIDMDSVPWFVRACRLAKVLKLCSVYIADPSLLLSHGPSPVTTVPTVLSLESPSPLQQSARIEQDGGLWKMSPMTEEITLWGVKNLNFMDQFRFLMECPQARSINWISPGLEWEHEFFNIPSEDVESLVHSKQRQIQDHDCSQCQHPLSQHHTKTIWPNLQSFEFHEYSMRKPDCDSMSICDKAISLLLQHARQLQSFKLEGKVIYSASIVSSLQQYHSQNLKHLRVRRCRSVTSEMVQRLLESCPNLTVITANVLTVDSILQGKPWVCHQLKECDISFELAVDSTQPSKIWSHAESPLAKAHHIIYSRLSTLTALERLSFVQELIFYSPSVKQPLRLCLSYGLDLLSTLRHLKVIDFTYTKQEVNAETVEWMISNWKHLSHVYGSFTSSSEDNSALATMLTDRGVIYSTSSMSL